MVAVGVLVVLAIGVGLLAASPERDLGTPTLDNRGPRGAAVLGAWLGPLARRSAVPLTQLDSTARTLVIAAPTMAEVSPAEVEALSRWVEGGGTLVYLASRTVPQPALHRWLELSSGALAPLSDEPGFDDVGGATATIRWKGGVLRDVSRLRVSAESTIELARPEAVPVSAPATLWYLPVGAGEVYVAAGPDLIENARLELLDNATFWRQVAARGPLVFDDYHHLASAVPPTPLTLSATLAQLLVVGLAFVATFGPRLGPARPEPARSQRSATEYIEAMARLTERVRDDAELIAAFQRQARELAYERLGVARTFEWPEAARAVAARQPDAGAAFDALGRATTLLEAAQRGADVERAIVGARRS